MTGCQSSDFGTGQKLTVVLCSVHAQEALHAAGLPCDQFEEIEGQARAAARQAAAAEERAAAAEEEVAVLRAELADRPTQVGGQGQWRATSPLLRVAETAVWRTACSGML